MNYLLIGGAQSVGKSETIFRLANNLISRGFTLKAGTIPTTFTDFRCVLEGLDNNKNIVKIILNSPSDTVPIINDFKKFYDTNGGIYDIVISSIRDEGFHPRTDFFRIMNLNPITNFILEIPLAKITRRGTNFTTALNWYNTQIDNLINHSLQNQPFNL